MDLHAGYADRWLNRKWNSDTLTIMFSGTKVETVLFGRWITEFFQALASTCLAILIDRGLASYDDLVTKYWPEYGQNGKEKTTLLMVVNHEVSFRSKIRKG